MPEAVISHANDTVAGLTPPRGSLENDAITVWILERGAIAIPIGIERGDRIEAGIAHPLNGGFPLICVWNIKDEQMVLSRRATRYVTPRTRKLEMVRRSLLSQHDAVEALVVLEPIEELQAKAFLIEPQQAIQVIARSGDPECWNCRHKLTPILGSAPIDLLPIDQSRKMHTLEEDRKPHRYRATNDNPSAESLASSVSRASISGEISMLIPALMEAEPDVPALAKRLQC